MKHKTFAKLREGDWIERNGKILVVVKVGRSLSNGKRYVVVRHKSGYECVLTPKSREKFLVLADELIGWFHWFECPDCSSRNAIRLTEEEWKIECPACRRIFGRLPMSSARFDPLVRCALEEHKKLASECAKQ